MSQCQSTAYLRVEGRDVATLRCQLEAGHGALHVRAFEWDDDAGIEWPEAYDADESFDVEVDALPHEAVVDERIAAQSVGDDEAIERSHAAVDGAARSRLDSILDEHRVSIRAAADEASAAKTRDLQRRYGSGPGRGA